MDIKQRKKELMKEYDKKMNALDLIVAFDDERLEEQIKKRNIQKSDLISVGCGMLVTLNEYNKYEEIKKWFKEIKKGLINEK